MRPFTLFGSMVGGMRLRHERTKARRAAFSRTSD